MAIYFYKVKEENGYLSNFAHYPFELDGEEWSTRGREELIEKTTTDYYWGCGTNGTGRNMLGIILMEVRDMLK